MTTKPAGKAARPRKGAAARAETNGKPRSISFRKVKLTLPPKLPAAFGYGYYKLQKATDDSDQIPLVFDLILSILGQAELDKVFAQVASDGDALDSLDDILGELLEAVFEEYGMSSGEASASAKS